MGDETRVSSACGKASALPQYIEQAKKEDIEDILSLVELFCLDNGYENHSLDKIKNTAILFIDNENCIVNLLKDEKGSQGIVAAVISPSYFSEETYAIEIIYYIKKDKRNYRNAMLLLNSYLDWANENADVTQLIANSGLPSVEKLYRRKGFEKKEVIFNKRRS